MRLAEFNQLDIATAEQLAFACCHCRRWSCALAAARPFASCAQLLASAAQLWDSASEAEILEAFGGHARIGDVELLKSRYAGRALSEQGQVLAAADAVIQELFELNQRYERQNGFIFIVCASGKSAAEMLELLRARLGNSRARELRTGAQEQGKITRLRLQNLIAD